MNTTGELFEDLQNPKHAGASPWARYKKSKGGEQAGKIGWLTFTVLDESFLRLVRYAEKNDDWRETLNEAIRGICDI